MVFESGDRAAVLDAGYVQLVEHWGSDERIIEAARMSTDKGFLGWGPKPCPQCSIGTLVWGEGCEKCNQTGKVEGDEKLLRYLWTHGHTTPFEMAGLTIEVQAPIFVFREWHRHRTQSYNELSARYTELPDLSYVPSLERVMDAKQSQANRQGSEGGFTEKDASRIRYRIELAQKKAREAYEQLLEQGVSREVARVVVPVSQYSRMRASTDLWNWLHFLRLRMAENAQWEIRQYANVVGTLVAQLFPRTWELFAEGRR